MRYGAINAKNDTNTKTMAAVNGRSGRKAATVAAIANPLTSRIVAGEIVT